MDCLPAYGFQPISGSRNGDASSMHVCPAGENMHDVQLSAVLFDLAAEAGRGLRVAEAIVCLDISDWPEGQSHQQEITFVNSESAEVRIGGPALRLNTCHCKQRASIESLQTFALQRLHEFWSHSCFTQAGALSGFLYQSKSRRTDDIPTRHWWTSICDTACGLPCWHLERRTDDKPTRHWWTSICDTACGLPCWHLESLLLPGSPQQLMGRDQILLADCRSARSRLLSPWFSSINRIQVHPRTRGLLGPAQQASVLSA